MRQCNPRPVHWQERKSRNRQPATCTVAPPIEGRLLCAWTLHGIEHIDAGGQVGWLIDLQCAAGIADRMVLALQTGRPDAVPARKRRAKPMVRNGSFYARNIVDGTLQTNRIDKPSAALSWRKATASQRGINRKQ
jgi:hypothetical protein